MKGSYFTRKELADELGIDSKTLRAKLQKHHVKVEKGLIPIEKVKEILIKLRVKPQNPDDKITR